MKQEFDRGSHHLKRCLHVWQTQNNYLLFFFLIIFSWFGLCVFLHRSSLWWESLDGENFFLSIPFCWERDVKQATDTFLKTEVNDPAICFLLLDFRTQNCYIPFTVMGWLLACSEDNLNYSQINSQHIQNTRVNSTSFISHFSIIPSQTVFQVRCKLLDRSHARTYYKLPGTFNSH